MDAFPRTRESWPASVLGLNHIGEGDEGQAAYIGRVQGPIVGRIVGGNGVGLTTGECGELVRPFVDRRIEGRAAGDGAHSTRNGRGSGLMRAVSHDLYRVRVQFLVGDGLGGIVQNWRDMVLRLDVSRNRSR